MVWAEKQRTGEEKEWGLWKETIGWITFSLFLFLFLVLKSFFFPASVFWSGERQSLQVFVCVCVCEADREMDCFLLFVLVCFDSELVEIYVGLVCVFGGSCMYSLPPHPQGEPRPLCPSLFCTCINTDWVGHFIKDSCVCMCVCLERRWLGWSFLCSTHSVFKCSQLHLCNVCVLVNSCFLGRWLCLNMFFHFYNVAYKYISSFGSTSLPSWISNLPIKPSQETHTHSVSVEWCLVSLEMCLLRVG